jgi:hypothetical protein
MSEIHAYVALFIVTLIFLNSHYSFARNKTDKHVSNLMIVEHLAQFSTKPKNYRRTPENYKTFGYKISGFIHGEEATLEYRFPFINGRETAISIRLHAQNVSGVISQFGVQNSTLSPADEESFRQNLNRDGFYYDNQSRWGIDYNHVIRNSAELTAKIALHLVAELQRSQHDSYISRIEAALNFVQYIPYGVPEFDEGEYIYGGLAIPHESVAISYSDCDSKSTLFAGILSKMIASENIVLVICKHEGEGHMITGVSDLNFPGQRVDFSGKSYLLIETTSPVSFGNSEHDMYEILEIIPVRQAT